MFGSLIVVLLFIVITMSQGMYIIFLRGFYYREFDAMIVVGIIVLSIIQLIQSFFPFNEVFFIPMNTILLMLFIKMIFYTNWTQSYYFSFLYNLYALSFRGIYFSTISIASKISLEYIYQNKVIYTSGVFASMILMALLIIIIRRIYIVPNSDRPLKIIDERFDQLVFSYTSLSLISVITYASIGFLGGLLIQIGVFIIVGITIYYSSLTFYLNSLDLTEMEFMNKHHAIYKSIIRKEERYNKLISEVERFRYLEHDYKNLMNVLEKILVHDDHPVHENKQLIQEFARGFANEVKVIEHLNGKYSNNLLLDEILLEVENICKMNDIEFSGKLNLPQNIQVSTFELIRIVINILDNAISYNLKLENKNRYIHFITKSNGEWLTMIFRNAFYGSLIMINGLPQTSKEKLNRHGFGLKIVRQLIEKWGGIMTIDSDDEENEFLISISIKYNSL